MSVHISVKDTLSPAASRWHARESYIMSHLVGRHVWPTLVRGDIRFVGLPSMPDNSAGSEAELAS